MKRVWCLALGSGVCLLTTRAEPRDSLGDAPDPPVVENCEPDLTEPEALYAIHRPDNDDALPGETDGEPIALPPVVDERVRQVLRQRYRTYVQAVKSVHDRWFRPLRETCDGVYLVRGPGSIDVYVVHMNYCFWAEAGFLVHDTATHHVTVEPARIDTCWMQRDDDLLERPLVSFEDLDGDSSPELVIEKRVHNGTMVNRVRYSYFHIGEDLSLIPVWSRETREPDISRGKFWISRRLEKSGSGEIVLHVDVRAWDSGCVVRDLGLARYTSTHPGAPFVMRSRETFLEELRGFRVEDLLVPTMLGSDE